MPVKFYEAPSGAGFSLRATLTITSLSGPGSMVILDRTNSPVWVVSDSNTDTRYVEQSDDSDDYATWNDKTGSVAAEQQAIEKV